jgi:hypothetical protein
MIDREFKKKLITQLVIFAVIIGVVVVFVVLFELNISNQTDALVASKKQRVALYNSSQNFSQLSQEAKEARGYEVAVSGLVPTENQVLLVQKNLQDLGASQGVAVNITFGQETAPDASGMRSISFTATAEGPSVSVFNFLRMSQAQYPYIDITALDVTTQNNRASFSGIMLFAGK